METKTKPLFLRIALLSSLLLASLYVAALVSGEVMQRSMPVLGAYAYKALMFVFTWLVVTASLRSFKTLERKAAFWEKALLVFLIALGAGTWTWLFSAFFTRWGKPDSLLAFSFRWKETLFFVVLALLAALFGKKK